jgi:CRISPR-associated exonuclease Cas4
MLYRKRKRGSAVDEWDYIPISRLSHAGYCLRRAALLTNEQIWQESSDTAKGRAEHDKVHTARTERRGDEVKLYEYPVFSDRLGISGKCDCVEAVHSEDGCMVPTIEFPVTLYPVEFKHGKVRTEEEYEIQLCAQAMCLEDMYHTHIPEGALFYISSHRRYSVSLNDELREKVKRTISALETIRREFYIPPAEYGPKCV